MIEPLHADDHATPLAPEERNGLIPTHITLRNGLNELEQQNIGAADRWAFSRRHVILRERFLRSLHRRMFNQVWRWAGTYRTSERNLGVAHYKIETELRHIIDDARYWVEHGSYAPDALAVRFHYRLVAVHPFPNGRWSRLAADVLIVQQGGSGFTWGRANLQAAGDVRKRYIDALHAADNHDLAPLLRFARL